MRPDGVVVLPPTLDEHLGLEQGVERLPLRERVPKLALRDGAVGFEAELSAAADRLRNNMDAVDDKHVVLGLILLRRFSDFGPKNADTSKNDGHKDL